MPVEPLRAHVGQTVDVHGVPTMVGHSKDSSVLYLNFGSAHQALSVVFFSHSHGASATNEQTQTEEQLKAFVGKSVVVHGEITDYKGDLQIVIKSLDQVHMN